MSDYTLISYRMALYILKNFAMYVTKVYNCVNVGAKFPPKSALLALRDRRSEVIQRLIVVKHESSLQNHNETVSLLLMEPGHENRRTICQNILRRARAPKHRWLILSVKGTMGKNTIKSRMKCPYDTQACVWGPHDWCRRTLTRRGHYTQRTLDTRLTEEPLRLMKGPLRSLRVGFDSGEGWSQRCGRS